MYQIQVSFQTTILLYITGEWRYDEKCSKMKEVYKMTVLTKL